MDAVRGLADEGRRAHREHLTLQMRLRRVVHNLFIVNIHYTLNNIHTYIHT